MITGAFSPLLQAGGPGSSSVLTLMEPFSAATAAMGEATAALYGAPYYINSNPASLYGISAPRISLMYRRGIDLDDYAALSLGWQKDKFGLGLGIQYYSTGDIDMYNLAGQKLTSIGSRDIIVNVAGSAEVMNIVSGINIKAVTSEIFGEKGTAFAADAGLQYRKLNYVTLALAARNMSGGIKYLNQTEELPLNVAAGLALTPLPSVTASLEIPHYVNEDETFLLAGAQFLYNGIFALRGGYRHNLTEPGAQDISISFGGGIYWRNLSLDYAMGLAEDISSPHNLSFNYSF